MLGPLLLVIAAGAADLLGSLLAMVPLKFSQRAILVLFGVSGGYMLTWSVADLIPLLVGYNPSLVAWVLAGYFGLYILENVFASHAHPAPVGDSHGHALVDRWERHPAVISQAASWAAVGGLLIHGFLDGVAIVASFAIQASVGALVFVAVLIHKVPEGSSLTSILGAARQPTRSIVVAAVATALMTVVGGIVAMGIRVAEPHWAYPLLALSAGTFLFIGASNLIPATQKGQSPGGVASVIAGAVIFYGISLLLRSAGLAHD